MFTNNRNKQAPPIGYGFNLTNMNVINELKTLQFNMTSGLKRPVFGNFYELKKDDLGLQRKVNVDWRKLKGIRKAIKNLN